MLTSLSFIIRCVPLKIKTLAGCNFPFPALSCSYTFLEKKIKSAGRFLKIKTYRIH